ncbi:hypothetical protein ULO1_13250 [Carboxydocella sp. ULO1]|nr:hypothetical protein ULO1_13250 [Carboxydocella sp. ULO1]
MKKLKYKKKRKSKGRRRLNHEAVYELTVKQVMEGEADFLNDLCYDPVILK